MGTWSCHDNRVVGYLHMVWYSFSYLTEKVHEDFSSCSSVKELRALRNGLCVLDLWWDRRRRRRRERSARGEVSDTTLGETTRDQRLAV